VAGGGERRAGLAAIGGVGQHLEPWPLPIKQRHPGGAVGRVGRGERCRGDQASLGLGGHVGFVAVAVAADALVQVPCLGVDHRDDSVGRHLARDAPTPLGVAWLDVLAGHQGEQADRLGLVSA
jgi:hypothetical protein